MKAIGTNIATTIAPLETPDELAARLRCSTKTVLRMVPKGLPCLRLSRKVLRFDRQAVDAWLAAQGRAA